MINSQVLHFIGHGIKIKKKKDGDQYKFLVLGSESGQADLISELELERLIGLSHIK